MKNRTAAIIVLSLMPVIPELSRAQTAAGIAGVVTDAGGHAVKDAVVRITAAKQGAKSQTTTGADGAFAFAQVEPDTYEVLASAPEFSDYTTSVQVGAGQTRKVNISLSGIAESTRITIDERGTTMDQSSARTGINVTSKELAQIPLNGHIYAALALTAPGATNTGDGALDKLRFNGQSAAQNRFTYDGVDASGVFNTPTGWMTLSGTRFHLQTSVETLEEFRADSSLYPAEYGSATGGQVSMASRSGGMEWHGSLFEYFRNDNLLSARNFFDGAKASELKMNQFGANAGGALVKDKLFASASFEGLRQRTGLNVAELVPGDVFSVPSAVQPVLSAFPRAANSTAMIDTFHRNGLSSLDETTGIGRLDYLLSSGHRIFARYFREAGQLSAPDTTVTPRNLEASNNPDNFVASWSGSVGRGFVNDLRIGMNRVPAWVASSTTVTALQGALVNLTSDPISAGSGGGIAMPGGLSPQIGGGYNRAMDVRSKSYTISDSASRFIGTHNLKAGLETVVVRVPFHTLGGTVYEYGSPMNLMSNQPTQITYTPDLDFRTGAQERLSAYFQDEWRLRPNLTLNAGLRFEFYGSVRETQNRARVFDVGTFTYLDPNKGFPRATKALDPRLALSWAPSRFGGKTVVRLGGGVYSGPGQFADTMAPLIGSAERQIFTGQQFPFTPAAGQTGLSAPTGFDAANYRNSERNVQYGISIQQQLPLRFIAQVGYTGSISRHLVQRSLANVAGADGSRARPAFGEVEFLTSGGRSNYNALQVGVTRRFVDDLTLGTAYTWSHGIGDSQGSGEAALPQNPACLACERGDIDGDVRQVLSLNAVYDIPAGAGRRYLRNGIAANLLGGFSLGGVLNVRTGLPVNAVTTWDRGFTSTGLSTRQLLRPNYVWGKDAYLKQGTAWLNSSAFTSPLAGTYGNLGRNALRGPGFAQLDLMLSRKIALGENRALELRGEVFNAFNHANFSSPFGTLPPTPNGGSVPPGGAAPTMSTSGAGFGSLISTVGQNIGLGTSRQVQVGVRFSF